MSDSNELKPPPGTPVPDLIQQYRVRRDAWIAQADELARLRDEVRGSAEREAMEIVTAARRDVRQIVMEARRELLVLSAQVQAALGEAGARPDPSALLNRAREADEASTEESADFSTAVFAPDEAVKGMLEEARADMEALVEDARTVPFQALAEPAPSLPPPPEHSSMLQEPIFISSSAPPSSPSPSPSISPTSRVLLSSPFPSDAVPVPSDRRVRIFVGLFGVAGVAIVAGTLWWFRGGDSGPAVETANRSTPAATSASATPGVATAASPTPSTESPVPAAAPAPAATPAPSGALSLLVEARRSSWLRATVDGQSSDGGRMLAQGETVRLTAKRSVALRVGDAGAVFVSVNNGQPSPLGRDGQVVTRQFVVESGDRDGGQPGGSPLPQTTPNTRSPELSGPVASASPSAPTPVPTPLPLVQPVAAAPSPAPPAAAPAPTPRAETTPPPAVPRPELPNPGPATPVAAVTAAARQWLDAYQRQDRTTMASLSTEGLQLADERRTEEKFPASMDVTRSLDRISVQIAADTAVLTAVMTEKSSDNGMPPRVSPISQVWELRGNQWRVRQVRLVSEARLNQIFR
jgi:predicted lipid-binding transport protein (Tim44 family)